MPIIWRTHAVEHAAQQYRGTGETGMQRRGSAQKPCAAEGCGVQTASSGVGLCIGKASCEDGKPIGLLGVGDRNKTGLQTRTWSSWGGIEEEVIGATAVPRKILAPFEPQHPPPFS